jgi:hypothetical protein
MACSNYLSQLAWSKKNMEDRQWRLKALMFVYFLIMGLSQQMSGPQVGQSSIVQPLVTVTSISHSGWSHA